MPATMLAMQPERPWQPRAPGRHVYGGRETSGRHANISAHPIADLARAVLRVRVGLDALDVQRLAAGVILPLLPNVVADLLECGRDVLRIEDGEATTLLRNGS